MKRERRFLTLDEVTESTPLTLANAAEIAFPGCGITVWTLRHERDKGRLAVFRVGGRDYTTLKAIEDLKALAIVRPTIPVPEPTSQDAFMEKLRLRREADQQQRAEARAQRKAERDAAQRDERLKKVTSALPK